MQNSSFAKELAKGCKSVEDIQEKLKDLFRDLSILSQHLRSYYRTKHSLKELLCAEIGMEFR
jgi:NTP pyrophosphatase (non-canonical NTP hydrolase)